MKTDDPQVKMMPLIVGPQEVSNALYVNTESVVLQYETEKEAIAGLLPESFNPGEEPLVTVAYSQSQGVDFMAGNGYRFFSVAVAAEYDGEEDHYEGDFALVVFEDATLPIIMGRELQGVPKIYADISPVRTMDNDLLRCEASLWGHFLFGIELQLPMKRQNAIVCKAASKLASNRPVLAYKYIPSLHGPPDAEYPTILWSDHKIHQLWLGKSGRLDFGDPGERDIGVFKSVLDALKTLPVEAVTRTSRSNGSMIIRNDRSGRLR